MAQNISLKIKADKESKTNLMTRDLSQGENGKCEPGKIFPLYNDISFEERFPTSEANLLGRFTIFFFFLKPQCGSCIKQNIEILNEFRGKLFLHDCGVVGITNLNEIEMTEMMRGQKADFPIWFYTGLEGKIGSILCDNSPSMFLCSGLSKRIILSMCLSPLKDSREFLQRYVEYIVAGIV
jgi:hypothetical protein